VKITISAKEERDGILWEMYVLGEEDKPLAFDTFKEAINFLAARGWMLNDILDLDFNVEEEK
jgi:hypothetical protein